tara:strand:+ start:1771 stop:1977 length:207 start_codon:yes stop_codon:yes gene_type:complete
MSTIIKVLKNSWFWAYAIIGFALPVVLHTAGVFYDPIEMEASDGKVPILLALPAVLVFAANVYLYHKK